MRHWRMATLPVTAAIVGLGLLLAPTGAGAAATCAFPEQPIVCEAEEREAQEKGLRKAVERLTVTVKSVRGHTYAHPGASVIKLSATPEAEYMAASDAAIGKGFKWSTAEEPANEVKQPWSCRSPHQSFIYVLTAQGSIGPPVSGTAAFHAELSPRWCSRARAAERVAKRRAAERRAAKIRHRQPTHTPALNPAGERASTAVEHKVEQRYAEGRHVIAFCHGRQGNTLFFCEYDILKGFSDGVREGETGERGPTFAAEGDAEVAVEGSTLIVRLLGEPHWH